MEAFKGIQRGLSVNAKANGPNGPNGRNGEGAKRRRATGRAKNSARTGRGRILKVFAPVLSRSVLWARRVFLALSPFRPFAQLPSRFSISATFASSSFTRWLSLDRRLKFIFCWMKSRTGTAGLPMTECRGATLPESPA